MTNITVFDKDKKKCIEFHKIMSYSGETWASTKSPNEYDNVCFLGKHAVDDWDIILAWNNSADFKVVYLGHWNDGVVE